MSNRFIVAWDQLGLETIWDLGESEEQATLQALQGKQNAWNQIIGQKLSVLMLRARTNSHRHYEIYLIETADIGLDNFRRYFNQAPQETADLIRSRGVKIYSDREDPQRTRIR